MMDWIKLVMCGSRIVGDQNKTYIFESEPYTIPHMNELERVYSNMDFETSWTFARDSKRMLICWDEVFGWRVYTEEA
jgi:hypothetical protein